VKTEHNNSVVHKLLQAISDHHTVN
jgi:hypothetical protein